MKWKENDETKDEARELRRTLIGQGKSHEEIHQTLLAMGITEEEIIAWEEEEDYGDLDH